MDLAKEEDYLHVNRTSHNDQTNFCNAVEKVFGKGRLDLRNVTQFIHSFSDIQKSFHGGSDEIKPLLKKVYETKHGTTSETPNDYLARMQEPLLTR